MSEFRSTLSWSGATSPANDHSRAYDITTGSGIAIPGSSAPEYGGDPARFNPEEALVGALNACHMLTFLAVAGRRRLVVTSYQCDATGTLEKDESGKISITKIHLAPHITFSTDVSPEDLHRLHEAAHRNCFIASSIKAQVTWS